jgi:hypothetical protein
MKASICHAGPQQLADDAAGAWRAPKVNVHQAWQQQSRFEWPPSPFGGQAALAHLNTEGLGQRPESPMADADLVRDGKAIVRFTTTRGF